MDSNINTAKCSAGLIWFGVIRPISNSINLCSQFSMWNPVETLLRARGNTVMAKVGNSHDHKNVSTSINFFRN